MMLNLRGPCMMTLRFSNSQDGALPAQDNADDDDDS